MSGTQSPANAAANAQAVNDSISRLIRRVATEVTQEIYSYTQATPGTTQNQFNITWRNVGLVKGFIVEVQASLTNSGTGAATLTELGAANIVSNFTLTDLDNYQRINTPGWHMAMLNAAKEGMPFGTALLSSAMDTPLGFGNNSGGNVIAASSTIGASGGTGTITMRYWVPAAYSKHDLRGAIYAGVVNANAYLNVTLNPAPGVATGDATLACYSGASSNVTISSATVKAYQVYLDQLPRYTSGPQAGKPILPPVDVSTQYRLAATSMTGVSANQDFAVPFPNFQQFLSLMTIYDQAGTLNPGSDINYFALAMANTYQTFKTGPFTQMLKQRLRLKTDPPKGLYLFDFRDAPVDTNQAGNMQLLINPSSAAAGTSVLCAFESFALTQAVLGAQSLPSS